MLIQNEEKNFIKLHYKERLQKENQCSYFLKIMKKLNMNCNEYFVKEQTHLSLNNSLQKLPNLLKIININNS